MRVILSKSLWKRLLYVFFLFFAFFCILFFQNITHNDPVVNNVSPPEHLSQFLTQAYIQNVLPRPFELSNENELPDELPWFMKKGTKWPKPHALDEKLELWPEDNTASDRIVDQLMYVPNGYDESTAPMKTIILWNSLHSWIKPGQTSFLEDKCPVNRCTISNDHTQAATADAILFQDYVPLLDFNRPYHQVWIIYMLESPLHTPHIQYNDLINWTATYRRDSEIVTPYERWVYYNENMLETTFQERNFAANKTGMVAWFVSNCSARKRLEYAHELQKYIAVDIYGLCGSLKCPRTEECLQLLDKKYKFYLAFENSHCVDYITEKFFVNGLMHDVLPVVMGAKPENYLNVGPRNSYLHVDDFASPKELADYLLKLDKDEDLYNSYFRWKGSGEFINTFFFCRVCAMLHAPPSPRTYHDPDKWWRNTGTCT